MMIDENPSSRLGLSNPDAEPPNSMLKIRKNASSSGPYYRLHETSRRIYIQQAVHTFMYASRWASSQSRSASMRLQSAYWTD